MLAAEIQVIKDVVDNELPKLIAAEVTRIPTAYQALVQAVVAVLLPMASQWLDTKIAAIPAA